MCIHLLFLVPLLVTMVLALFHGVQKVNEEKKNGNNTRNDPKSEDQFWSKPRCSGRKIARELNISWERIQHILGNKVGLKPNAMDKKKVRLERAKELLRLHESSQLPNLVFSDEKPFQIEQFVNKQNYRVYLPKRSAENLHLRLATRTQAPPMVMMWAAVTAYSSSLLVFIGRRVKINAEYYWQNVLKTVLKPWADKYFGHRSWTFQQDSLNFYRTMASIISESQSVGLLLFGYFGE